MCLFVCLCGASHRRTERVEYSETHQLPRNRARQRVGREIKLGQRRELAERRRYRARQQVTRQVSLIRENGGPKSALQ